MISTGVKCLANRILLAKDFLRASLADQDHILILYYIVFIEIATGKKRDAKCLKVIGGDIVTRGRGTLIDRQNRAIGARIKRLTTGAGEQGDVTADRRALDSWDGVQRGESSFHETLARGRIGILRLRQRNQAYPQMFGAKPNVLAAQLHKAGDE